MAQLHLADMSARRDGEFTLYSAPVADRRGETRYEATIHGPRRLVDAVLGKSGLDIAIDPDASEQDSHKRIAELLRPHYERQDVAMREPWKVAAPRGRKAKEAPPKPSRTVTISLRRLSGKGTFWVIATPAPVTWPAGAIVQFVLPPCFTGGAMAAPLAGNPNVRIRFNSPFAPAAASAIGFGLTVDIATYVNAPWLHVYTFNQFNAVVPTPATAFLSCWGFSLFPF